MKKKSFGALLYREYLFARNSAFMTFIISVCTIVICLLISLSMKIGNLAKADESIRGLFATARLMGMYVSCCIMCIAETSIIKDETSNIWKLFRKSSPASPLMFSLAKFAFIFILMLISAALAGIYLIADSAISGSPAAFSDIAMLAVILAVISLMIITQVITMTLTGSPDKGGLLSMLILVPVIFFVRGKVTLSETASFSENMKSISEQSADAFPYLCAAILAMYIIGIAVTALLYKRREK